MKFLFIIFLFFVLFVFLFGFTIIRLFVKALFGTRPSQSSASQSRSQSKQKANTSQKETTFEHKKIFTPEEGEYVEYEEVKDQNSN